MSRNGLLVLADEPSFLSRRDFTFRNDVLVDGGEWRSRPASLKEMLDVVKAHAPGSHVLVLGAADEPVAELYALIRSAMNARGLADVLYGNFLRGTSDAEGEPLEIRRPAWSPHRLRNENYVGKSFLVRTSYFVLTLEQMLVGNDHITWNSWRFLAAGITSNATIERVDATWTVAHEMFVGEESTSRGAAADDSWRPPREAAGVAPKPEACEIITLTAGAADVSRGHATLIEECLKAMSATDAAQVRHTIVIGDECDAGVRQRCEVESGAHVTVVPTVGGFNFATRCNEVAIRSSAEILVFVDDDFIPTNPLWLSELLAPFADPSVAITGGTLLCGDETIQHIGVGIVHGNFTHLFVEESLDHPRVAELIDMNREVDAVTGACFAMRSDVFYHVGGFFDGFPLNYSDVDLCLKARAAGYSVIHVGAPLGYHLESKTRHGVTLAEEMTLFHSRWSADIVSEYPGDYSF